MRAFLLTAILFSTAYFCRAQDSIFLRSNKLVLGKVLEIGEQTIIYKKADNLQGPDYKLSVNSIEHIVFENGTVEKFKRKFPAPPPAPHRERYPSQPSARVQNIIKNKKLYPQTLPDNLLSAGVFIGQTVFNNANDEKIQPGVYVKYERLLLSEILGAGITAYTGLSQKRYGAKASLTGYTKFFGKLRMGIGPYYAISQQSFNRSYRVFETLQSGAMYSWVNIHDEKATLGTVGMVTTAMLHLNTKLLLSLGADVGGVVHINDYEELPSSWEKQRRGAGVTLGQFNIGLTRRF